MLREDVELELIEQWTVEHVIAMLGWYYNTITK